MSEIALLPKLVKNCKREDFNSWKVELLTFVDLVVKEEETDIKGLKYLKYAVAGAQLGMEFDGRATFKSALEKVESTFRTVNQVAFPLREFYELRWCNEMTTITAYIEKLKNRLEFITDDKAKEQLIVQHVVEQLTPELRIILTGTQLPEMIRILSKLPKEQGISSPVGALTNQPGSSITCHNCGEKGHLSSKCSKERKRCKFCDKTGHLKTFCRSFRRFSKNGSVAPLLVEQSGHLLNEVSSDQSN